jgi:HSP20 family protein
MNLLYKNNGVNKMTDNKETVDLKEQEPVSLKDILEKEPVFVPFVNIYETGDNFILVANLPGVSKENVKLKLEEGYLSILGKINYGETANRKYILNEAEVGNYYRKFKISSGIDETKIDAKYENGQLIVILPKHDRVKPRSISVK